jgi:hypothetical protein
LERNAEFAKWVADEIGGVDRYGDVDRIFEAARAHFVGGARQSFRQKYFPAVKQKSQGPLNDWSYDASSFDDMTAHFRDPELDGITETDESRPARTLLLVAAEYTLAPLLEGVLAATRWWPVSARFDLRSGFHAITRWGFEVDPRSARLVAPALTYRDELRPWGTLTQFFYELLERQRLSDYQRNERAVALSLFTLDALDKAHRHREPKGAVMRRLLSEAERLGVLESRPPRWVEPDAETRSVLAELILRSEIGDEPFAAEVNHAIELLGAEAR